ncbi:MAG: aminotransferase class III-fold pyridoxal phosphate-dependent enzyme [Pseudomonadota bacterium]
MKDHNFTREMNARHLWHPMAHPAESLADAPVIITKGEGVRITDIDGHETIDAVGGLWNVNLGFSCQPVIDAISSQLATLPYYSCFRGTTNDAAIELSTKLAEFFAPDGLSRTFFTSGGSDSVETALKLARQYHKARGEPGRVKFISLVNGYHGTHFGGASVTGNAKFRAPYEPLLPGCFHIPGPYLYRNPFGAETAEELASFCLSALEAEIAMQGPDTIAAFIMEPVLGAGGVIPPHASFMPGVREICSRHGVLLIADEVITAFGRTGSWSGSRHWGVQPDLMTTAKAITNGYFPFGAVMISDGVAEVFESDEVGRASIGHGYTYSGHPVGAAAALACLAETERLNVTDNAASRGAELYAGLVDLKDKHDAVGDVRGGHGLMCAIELVSDPASKSPPAKDATLKVQSIAYRAGAMVRASGPNIILSPPLVLEKDDVGGILDALDFGLSSR